jgi:hypothetical protein
MQRGQRETTEVRGPDLVREDRRDLGLVLGAWRRDAG